MKKTLLMITIISAYAIAGDPGSGQNYIGINIGSVLDFEGNIIFADAMKSAREWCYPDNTWNNLPANNLDAQGWPIVDAELVVWSGLSRNNSGTYLISFESNTAATVEIRLTAGNIQNASYNSGTHTNTANIILTDTTSDILCLRFTGTNGGVRNVKLMRPIAPGSSTSHTLTDDFSQPFLNAIAPFHALRFMDYLGTYGNPQQHWIDRVQPNYASFNRSDSNASWLGKGGAWEYIIKLCNQTQKDAWICISLLVDDDYIHQVARLFRDGNTFTGNQGLNSNVKLYIEYANEVWNTGGAFDGNRNHNLAIQEHAGGDPYRYNFDNNDNDWYWSWRRVARRALDISQIFRQEFGDVRMMNQIRPVFEWQLGYTAVGLDPLYYLEEAYIPLANPGKPVSYFFYGGGGSAYYNPNNESDNLTLDNFWQSETMNENVWGNGDIGTDATLCATFGIKRTAYEGGPSLDNTGHSESIKAQAWADARMGTAMTAHHNVWSEWGGDLLMYYTLRPDDYQWGFCSVIDNLTLPKYQATVSLSSAPRAPLSHFKSVPSVTPGIQFNLAIPGWKDSTHSWYTDIQDGEWRSYIYNIQIDGIYRISANYSNGGGGHVSLIKDGEEISSKIISGSGTDTILVNWTKGMHSVRVRATGASVTINSISVTIEGINDSAPPTIPTDLQATAVSTTQVNLTWTASTDNTFVSGYNIYRDGTLIGTSVMPNYNNTGLNPSTQYIYTVAAFDIIGNTSAVSNPASVETLGSSKDFKLYQNYPNPFNPSTTISFSVGTYGYTSLKIFDILGREITTLVNEIIPAGNYNVQWDGKNSIGQRVGSGVYFYQLRTESSFTKTQKMILLN